MKSVSSKHPYGTIPSMKTLFIDTTSNTEITVGLFMGDKKYFVKKPLERQKAQVVLPMIESLLVEHNVTLRDLTAIEVQPGPGSFTGVRVGVSVANTLAFALGIPVNGIDVLKEDVVVEPVYS
jgi:tRNA threonylcarbamoyladenosine biosynthesis protein TsaB